MLFVICFILLIITTLVLIATLVIGNDTEIALSGGAVIVLCLFLYYLR